jgi:hypothetical protein
MEKTAEGAGIFIATGHVDLIEWPVLNLSKLAGPSRRPPKLWMR